MTKGLTPSKKKQKAWEDFQKTGEFKESIPEMWVVLHNLCEKGQKDEALRHLRALSRDKCYPVARRLILSLVNKRNDEFTGLIIDALHLLATHPSTMPENAFLSLGAIMGQSLLPHQLKKILNNAPSSDIFEGALTTCGLSKSGENMSVIMDAAPISRHPEIIRGWCHAVSQGNIPPPQKIGRLPDRLRLRISPRSLARLFGLTRSIDAVHGFHGKLESEMGVSLLECATVAGGIDRKLYVYSRRALGRKNLTAARDFLIPRLTVRLYVAWVNLHTARGLILEDPVFALSQKFPHIDVVEALQKNDAMISFKAGFFNERQKALMELSRTYMTQLLSKEEHKASAPRKL